MHAWQLKEAKSRFNELVELTLTEGPQLVTRHGEEAVVILSAKDYRQLIGKTPVLMDCLLSAPRGEALEIERPRDGLRDVEL